MNEKMLLEQYKRRKDSKTPTRSEPGTTWTEAASGLAPWGFTFWKSFGSEAWDTAKGIPMLPYLFTTISDEAGRATGNAATKTFVNLAFKDKQGREGALEQIREIRVRSRAMRKGESLTQSEYASMIRGINFDVINELDTPLLKAIYDDYADVYGSGEGFKDALANEPFRVISDIYALGSLGMTKGGSLLLKTGKASRLAKALKFGGKAMDVMDPGNIPGRFISGGLGAAARILPPATNFARIKKQYGIDAGGNKLMTDLDAVEAAERFAAGAENAPLVMTREGDELAARESAIAFSEKDKEFDPATALTATGVKKRMALTEHVGREKVDERLQALADQVGVPYTHLKDPVKATEHILKGVITAWEQGDLAKRQAIADAVEELRGKATSSFEARVLLEDALKAETERGSQYFKDEYGKHRELNQAEVGELGEEFTENAVGIGFDPNSWERIKDSIFAHVLEGDIGSRLLSTFEQGTKDRGMINVEKAVREALPDLADLKVRTENGSIDPAYDIREELAYALKHVDTLIRREGRQGGDYTAVEYIIDRELQQGLLFDDPMVENARNLYKIVLRGRTNPSSLRDFIRAYVQSVKTMESPMPKEELFASILGEKFDAVPESLKVDLAPMMPSTSEWAKELTNKQGHTRTMLSDPDAEAALDIINDWFSNEMAEELGERVVTSGQGLTIGDFVRLRTNFRKRLDIAVGKGEITKVGAGDLNKTFYTAISEDIDNMMSGAAAEGRITPEQVEAYKETQREYLEYQDLQDTNVVAGLHKIVAQEGDVPAYLLGLDPRQLAQAKQYMGEEAIAEQQPAMLRRILDDSMDAEGNLDRRKLERAIGAIQVSLDDLLGEHANTLRGIFEQVKHNETVDKLRASPAAKFILRNVDRPDNLFYELTKDKGIFDEKGIADARKILGEEKWEQVKTALLGFIFEQGHLIKTDKAPRRSLSDVLTKMTSRDKNRLINIFGEAEAKELMEMAGFWERHGRLAGWNKGSQTTFHQYARDWMNMRTARRLAMNVAYWIQLRGLTADMMRATDIASITLLIGAFGGSYGFRKYMQTEAGRRTLAGEGIVTGRLGRVITGEQLAAAAEFVDKHNITFSHMALRGQQARERVKEKQKARKIVPAYDPLQRFMRQ